MFFVMQQWPKFTSVTFVFREIINFFSYTDWLLNFCFSKNHFIIILIRFHSPIVLMIYRLVIVTIKSGLRADKPVSFYLRYAEMTLNSTRHWIWTKLSCFRLQLEFSSKRFYIPGMVLSQYELTLSLETGSFNYVSRARYFFVSSSLV